MKQQREEEDEEGEEGKSEQGNRKRRMGRRWNNVETGRRKRTVLYLVQRLDIAVMARKIYDSLSLSLSLSLSRSLLFSFSYPCLFFLLNWWIIDSHYSVFLHNTSLRLLFWRFFFYLSIFFTHSCLLHSANHHFFFFYITRFCFYLSLSLSFRFLPGRARTNKHWDNRASRCLCLCPDGVFDLIFVSQFAASLFCISIWCLLLISSIPFQSFTRFWSDILVSFLVKFSSFFIILLSWY